MEADEVNERERRPKLHLQQQYPAGDLLKRMSKSTWVLQLLEAAEMNFDMRKA